MSRIAAAIFTDQPAAAEAMSEIAALGVAALDVETFVVNPPRRDLVALGGEEEAGTRVPAGEHGAAADAENALGAQPDAPSPRPAGVLVAVNLDRSSNDDAILDAMYDTGAQMIERAQGEWRDGHWIDFDPVAHPQHIDYEEQRS